MRKREELIHGRMAKARDDEMTFVLLGRDVAAPAAIRAWIAARINLGKNRPGDVQLIEAEECAILMHDERCDPNTAIAPSLPFPQAMADQLSGREKEVPR